MTYRNPRFDQPIRALMDFDHVVAVMPDGRVIDTDERFNPIDVHGPESVYVDYDGDTVMPSVSDEMEQFMAATLREQGWEALSGYSVNGGPILLHDSQFIGGVLEERIREEPGYWVKLSVDLTPTQDDEQESTYAGWLVARKIGSEDEIAARTQWMAEDLAPWQVDPSVKPPNWGYDADFTAEMSSPVDVARHAEERVVRLALITRLHQHAQFGHIKRAGESDLFIRAADEIANGAYSVTPSYRTMRVRAMLMPKEDSK